ncbi:putative DNA-binding protein YlxM (UPF0122 family) [Caldicoprobacter guelmensis]|uniref:YlxM family DNA-binding protein n=1 Tax=Caldicoprobacter guelmensis TaxID=1170224 RepID=UPI00195B08BB|nr:sigma factor-like helix-turn-helix DNA-binding protein [Caldicoprobacter guelmensis]MBM7581232.1 putative DNA-binding protein YlxM (UPF0122 family) [Caldicoprobacter guelmensis]
MEKLAKVALLLDIYGGLLTPRQRDVLDLYYNYDLSLGEIAEMHNISRQGVHDLIKRGEQALYALDKKLNYYRRWTAFEDKMCQAIRELEYICQLPDESFAESPGEIKQRLMNLKQRLVELGDTWIGRLENGV